MKVAVIGAGGVGGYFGARLADAGVEVHLLARGAHLEALRERGLQLHSVNGDLSLQLPATDDATRIGPCDHVLFCVKSFDTAAAAAAHLPPLLAGDTAVVSLQNGVDNEDVIAATIGGAHVLPGAAFIFATVAAPGVVDHTGGPARIVFGERDGRHSERTEQLRSACSRAGIDVALAADISVVKWRKLAFICAQAGMTAAVRLPLGDIRASAPAWTMFRMVVDEVCAVARAEGVPVPDGTADELVTFADGLDPASRSSLYHDLTAGKRMEVDALLGAAVRHGRTNGVPTPMCAALLATLDPWAARNEPRDR